MPPPPLRSPAPPRIITLTAADTGACVALEIAAFDPTERFQTRVWRRLIGPCQSAGSVLALGVRGPRHSLAAAIVVLLRRNCRVARIYYLAIDPGQRRRGLAKRLIATTIRRLPPRCTLLTLEVRVDNRSARALYSQLGFLVTARLADFYGDGDPGLRYELALPARPKQSPRS